MNTFRQENKIPGGCVYCVGGGGTETLKLSRSPRWPETAENGGSLPGQGSNSFSLKHVTDDTRGGDSGQALSPLCQEQGCVVRPQLPMNGEERM